MEHLESTAACIRRRTVDSTGPIPGGGPEGSPRGSGRDPITRPCKIPGVRRARTKPSVSVQGPGRSRARAGPLPLPARAGTRAVDLSARIPGPCRNAGALITALLLRAWIPATPGARL